ncbi:uncharacterized protein LOC110841907 [Folsomia candida]|uniref:O-acyltransferase WSD n=1 Tax=Folsomia candida TaxID=158441 RepID=A0A226F4R2_FOLCA|nr:uncharacterized protein LOC110841907 [Folsomia candida]XP_035709738.1 uncharacterized protein LOC110841907 [Folsomia candida]OXA64795.1 O-acyltransferase WSD [Folsomia candida]
MSLKFKIVFKEAFLILSSIFLSVFILPFVLVLFVCPLYMYRRIVIFFAPIFQALFQAPLSLNDFLVVCDDIHGRPRNSCCGVIYLKGRPAFADVVRRVEKALDGRPELTSTLTRWMSVYFWKTCQNFSLSNHVTQNDESDPDKISDLLINLIEKGYPLENPLWEFIYFRNYAHPEFGTSSAIVLRFHHLLGDGLAYMALIRDLFDPSPTLGTEIEKILKTLRTKLTLSPWKKFCYLGELLFITPSQTLYYYLKGLNSEVVPIKDKKTVNINSGVTHAATRVDLSVLKDISKKTGVKVTSIIHAGVTGAIRRLLLEKGSNSDGDLSTMYVLPKMNHPGTMTNNSFAMPLIAPMTPEPSQAARLARISDQFDRILFSPLSLGMMAATSLVGLMYGTFGTSSTRMPHVASCIHSNVVFVGEPMKLLGHVAETGILYPGLQPGGHHFVVTTTSYNGKLTVQLTGSRVVFHKREDLVKVADYVREEFDMLNKDGNVENGDIQRFDEHDKKNV